MSTSSPDSRPKKPDVAVTVVEPATVAARLPSRTPNPRLMLGLATLGFVVTFWAWALLSSLDARFRTGLGLSWLQQALLVAVPVVVGSGGRIPVGALTDRYGGCRILPAVSVATIIPMLLFGLWGHDSYAAPLIGGLPLGIGGAAFAVGVLFENGRGVGYVWFNNVQTPPAPTRTSNAGRAAGR